MKPNTLLRMIAEQSLAAEIPSGTTASYQGDWVEINVVITPDHTAQIIMPVEDYEELMKLPEGE